METIQPMRTSSVYRLKRTGQGTDTGLCICRTENESSFSVRLLTEEDLLHFVDFLNENRIEPIHVKDCYRDFLYAHFTRT